MSFLFFGSKCLGCVYVQRESKSSDFKGVSGSAIEMPMFFTLVMYIGG